MSLLRNHKIRYLAVAAALAVVTIGAVHVLSLEGVHGWFLSVMHDDRTVYAPGFGDAAFRRVSKGMSERDVRHILPEPLGEVWSYGDGRQRQAIVGFTHGRVDHVNSGPTDIHIGTSSDEVMRRLGEPREKCFVYSRTPNDGSYHVRVIVFQHGKVTERLSEFYVD
jgi:hypothetical protein